MPSLPASSARLIALTGPIAAADMDSDRYPRPISAMAASGLPAISPQSVTGTPAASSGPHDCAQRSQKGPRQRIEAGGNQRIAAIAGGHELQEIVRSDRHEIRDLEKLVELPQKRGHLDHRAKENLLRRGMTVAPEMRVFAVDQGTRPAYLVEFGDHRDHDPKFAAARRQHQGADLATQQPRPVEAEPDRPPAHRRILLLRRAHIRQDLVAADIERPECDRAAHPPR